MSRARYGDRSACSNCGFDVEFLGKPERQFHYTPMGHEWNVMKGGWTDRGGVRFCPDQRRLHKP